MPQPDLARDGQQGNKPERPGRIGRPEADLHEVLRLVYLYGVPGKHPGAVTDGNPPETARPHGACERPIHRRPRGIDDIGAGRASARRVDAAVAVWREPDVLRT